MAQRRSSFSVLAAALCAAILSLGIFAGFVSAQESPSPASNTATSSPFGSNEQFGQIVLDTPSQTVPEQWIRGRLASKISIPECPRNWAMLDVTGAEYYDSNFGTWGSPWGSDAKLRAYNGGLVEVHLLRDMSCMNTQDKSWRLASIEPLGTTQARWQVNLPILLRSHSFYNVDRYSGLVALIADGDPVMDYVLLNACGQLIAHIENALPSWNGQWITFNAYRYGRNGQTWLRWDGSFVDFIDPMRCWWTPTATEPVPDPTNTPIAHYDYFGEIETASERECAHAYIRLCGGGGTHRIALRHPTGPSYFERYIGRYVLITGQLVPLCDGSVLVETIGFAPGSCTTATPTYTPLPTLTSTPERTAVPTFTPGPSPTPITTTRAEGLVRLEHDPNCCGNARLINPANCTTIGWVTNAPEDWDGWIISFEAELRVCPFEATLLQLTWLGTPASARWTNLCPANTPTPTATEPGNPSATPTFTPTPTRTNTPVPPTSPPPTAVPGSFTAYFFRLWEDNAIGDCGTTVAVLCSGEIVKITNPPAAEYMRGQSFSFSADWLAECKHGDDHSHRILQVTSALVPASCPIGSVDVPEWKDCSFPLCWRYMISEKPGHLALVLLLPYGGSLMKNPPIPE